VTSTITPETLSNLRGDAEAGKKHGRPGNPWMMHVPCSIVIALLDRIEELEAKWAWLHRDASEWESAPDAHVTLTHEYLASLRKGAEHMRDHNLVLQDVRGEVTLAMLDLIEAQRGRVSEWQLATRCGSPVDAALLRRIAMEVAANMCTNVEDARRIRASAAEILVP
jgi:hypothetical protein